MFVLLVLARLRLNQESRKINPDFIGMSLQMRLDLGERRVDLDRPNMVDLA